jgi:23S rRNA pseudouridine2605 synthase
MNENKVRLARFIALCGVSSRRNSEALILKGAVKVNREVVTDLSFKVGSEDAVEIENRRLSPESKIAIALNKPAGYLSTAKDEFNRKTVLDLLTLDGACKGRLYPVGRLDCDSRGLIILTNDGELAYRITHPKFMVTKVYEIKTDREITPDDINRIKEGIIIEERELSVIELNVKNLPGRNSLVTIKIAEGRKRILRKVFQNLGYKVLDLKRTQIGGLVLGDIKEGEYKILNEEQIKHLIGKPAAPLLNNEGRLL